MHKSLERHKFTLTLRNQGNIALAVLKEIWNGRKTMNWELGDPDHIHHHVDTMAFMVLGK